MLVGYSANHYTVDSILKWLQLLIVVVKYTPSVLSVINKILIRELEIRPVRA